MILKIGTVKPCLQRFQHSVYLDSHKNMTIQVSHKKFSISKFIKIYFQKIIRWPIFCDPVFTTWNSLQCFTV